MLSQVAGASVARDDPSAAGEVPRLQSVLTRGRTHVCVGLSWGAARPGKLENLSRPPAVGSPKPLCLQWNRKNGGHTLTSVPRSKGYRQKDYFIATQGPLAHTVEDFWRMVWEWKCHTVVMLTEVQEREQVRGARGRPGPSGGQCAPTVAQPAYTTLVVLP